MFKGNRNTIKISLKVCSSPVVRI